MKTGTKIILGVVIFILILLTLKYAPLSLLNEPINPLIAGKPDTLCNVDDDCALKEVTCKGGCDCNGDTINAVNKNWTTYCPFKNTNILLQCKTCIPKFEARCIEHKCTKVPMENEG